MKGWKEVNISNLGKVITGNTPPRKNPELYGNHTIFIKPTDISEGVKYTYNPDECYSDLGFKKYKNSLIPKGSTCVVTIGSIGKKMTKAHCDCFVNQAVNAVVPFEEYDEEFIFYVLKYNLEQLKSFDSGTASGRENVSKSSFSSIKVNVPTNKNIQTKIGQILSAYDDLIENNSKRIKLLEELAQRTYEEWFVKFRINDVQLEVNEKTSLPEGWNRVSMTEIAEFLNGFAFKPSDWLNEGLPIIKIKEMKNGVGNETPRSDGSRVPEKFLIESGNILFSWSGSLEVIIWQGENGWLNQHLFKVKPINDAPREFVHQALLYALNEFNSLTTGATMKHIKRKELDFVKVCKPKRSILIEFEKLMNPVQNQILNLATQNRLLKEARDILLPRLMSGMVDVEELKIETLQTTEQI
jgi:type I restriction enzyme S subunit